MGWEKGTGRRERGQLWLGCKINKYIYIYIHIKAIYIKHFMFWNTEDLEAVSLAFLVARPRSAA